MYNYVLPKEVKTDKDGYAAIALVYHSIKSQKDLEVTIDFSKCIIVDCGLTIPHNVNSFLSKTGKDLLNPCEAIEWAFVDGNTTKDTPGGLGLAILKQFIEKNQGCLQMVSGDAFLEFSSKGTSSQLLSLHFPGTIVNMKFNFDDDNKYLMDSELNNFDINNLL